MMLLGERAIFAPAITALSLYFITRFEGKSHEDGVSNLNDLYKLILVNNWKYLTLPVLINFRFVPPMVSGVFCNRVGKGDLQNKQCGDDLGPTNCYRL